MFTKITLHCFSIFSIVICVDIFLFIFFFCFFFRWAIGFVWKLFCIGSISSQTSWKTPQINWFQCLQIYSGKDLLRYGRNTQFWPWCELFKIIKGHESPLTLFLPAMGWINPYTVITWHRLVGIGLDPPRGCSWGLK